MEAEEEADVKATQQIFPFVIYEGNRLLLASLGLNRRSDREA